MWTLVNAKRDLNGFLWSKKDSNYLDVKHKLFKKDDSKDIRLAQNITMGETELNQFMQLRNQMVIAAEKFVSEENFSPLLIPTMSKNTDEQIKLAHEVVDVVD